MGCICASISNQYVATYALRLITFLTKLSLQTVHPLDVSTRALFHVSVSPSTRDLHISPWNKSGRVFFTLSLCWRR